MKFFKLTRIALFTFSMFQPALHAAAYETNPAYIANALSKEFDCQYYLDATPAGQVKFKTERRDYPIVWVSNPEQVLKTSEDGTLLQMRFDNYGKGRSIFHLFVRKNISKERFHYQLELHAGTASLLTRDPNAQDLALIKEWVASLSLPYMFR